MPCRLCSHLKSDGRVCQSPALTARAWCYFHAPFHGVPRQGPRAASIKGPDTLSLPELSTPAAVHSAIAAVISAIASGKIDNARAHTLLHGLQLAHRSFYHSQPGKYRRHS